MEIIYVLLGGSLIIFGLKEAWEILLKPKPYRLRRHSMVRAKGRAGLTE